MALSESYANIQLALDSLASDVQQPKVIRLEAQSLSKKMDKLIGNGHLDPTLFRCTQPLQRSEQDSTETGCKPWSGCFPSSFTEVLY